MNSKKSKFKSRKSWREKLEKLQEPKVVKIPPKMQKRFPGMEAILIPRPLDVDALMRKIPKGKLMTQSAIRARLAKACRADVTCPITAGIFVRIAAEAAEEDLQNGKKSITPYWRVVRDDGSLNEKFPGGTLAQQKRLRQEGHHFESSKGKKPPKVAEFSKFLIA